MKRKEIKWRHEFRGTMTGRQDGIIFRIYRKWDAPEQGYTVSCHDTKKAGRTINTAGHMTFTWEEAVEFCQQIAAGEVDLETMRAKFAAEDAAKERTAIRRSIEEAKRFREELEKAGISYRTLLHLTALQQEMDGLAYNILLGFERGEGWPDGT